MPTAKTEALSSSQANPVSSHIEREINRAIVHSFKAGYITGHNHEMDCTYEESKIGEVAEADSKGIIEVMEAGVYPRIRALEGQAPETDVSLALVNSVGDAHLAELQRQVAELTIENEKLRRRGPYTAADMLSHRLDGIAAAKASALADRPVEFKSALNFSSLSREQLEGELNRCNDVMARDGKVIGELRAMVRPEVVAAVQLVAEADARSGLSTHLREKISSQGGECDDADAYLLDALTQTGAVAATLPQPSMKPAEARPPLNAPSVAREPSREQ